MRWLGCGYPRIERPGGYADFRSIYSRVLGGRASRWGIGLRDGTMGPARPAASGSGPAPGDSVGHIDDETPEAAPTGAASGVQERAYAQMYSSAMAPSCHLTTVTMRLPSSNSPMTQVHSPDPKAIGWEVIRGGVPSTEST